MNDALKAAIDELIADITAEERKLEPMKMAVNTLCKKVGIPDAYVIGEGSPGTASGPLAITWRMDHFTNRPLATCVAEILETRKERGMDGPASIDEIFSALTAGGFKFQGTSGSDENTKRGIKIAVTKNTAQFVKIRDDIFGLKRWYGGRGGGGKKSASTRQSGTPSGDAAEEPEAEEPLAIEDKQPNMTDGNVVE